VISAALAYALLGWLVFPVKPCAKAPLTSHGHLDATIDPAQIRRWWSRWPLANVGLACAVSDLLALDLDPRNGGENTMGQLSGSLGRLPLTVTAETGGGGLHLLFQLPKGVVRGNLGPGVDVKSRGYVIVPPSVHPSGGKYRWRTGQGPSDVEVACLPDMWLAQTVKPVVEAPVSTRETQSVEFGSSKYGMAALRLECDLLRACGEGARNIHLNRTAFRMAQLAAGGELEPEPARCEVLRAALKAGLGEWEALRTLQSGWAAGVRFPRRAPTGRGVRP